MATIYQIMLVATNKKNHKVKSSVTCGSVTMGMLIQITVKIHQHKQNRNQYSPI